MSSPWRTATSFDAALWFCIPTLVLLAVGVGFVSGDAVYHANRFDDGVLLLNPNHLLMEPIAKLWFDFSKLVNADQTSVDRLKSLDIVVGSLSLALFRYLLPQKLDISRVRANAATVALGGNYAFLSLWLSGEPIILQMPALVISMLLLLGYLKNLSLYSLAFSGGFFGIATLFFASNAVIVLFVASALLFWRSQDIGVRRSSREVGVHLSAWLAICSIGLVLGWTAAEPDVPLQEWLFLYRGEVPTTETPYGLTSLSVRAIGEATVRTVYGASMAITDVSDLGGLARDPSTMNLAHTIPLLALIASTAVLMSLAANLLNQAPFSRGVLFIITGWVLGILAFGIFYNNSDDQFFVQLAVPIATLCAVASIRNVSVHRLLAAVGGVVLLWNGLHVWRGQVAYPRDQRLEELADAVKEADYVLYPGHDEVERLLHLLPRDFSGQRLSLTVIAQHQKKNDAQALHDTLVQLLRASAQIRVVGILETAEHEQPWNLLKNLGLPKNKVVSVLCEFTPLRISEQDSYFHVYTLDLPGEVEEYDAELTGGCVRNR